MLISSLLCLFSRLLGINSRIISNTRKFWSFCNADTEKCCQNILAFLCNFTSILDFPIGTMSGQHFHPPSLGIVCLRKWLETQSINHKKRSSFESKIYETMNQVIRDMCFPTDFCPKSAKLYVINSSRICASLNMLSHFQLIFIHWRQNGVKKPTRFPVRGNLLTTL